MDFVYPLIIFGLLIWLPVHIHHSRLRRDPRLAGATAQGIVKSQAPLELLEKYFDDPDSAWVFYRQSMVQQFPKRTAAGPCVCCATKTGTEQWIYRWGVRLRNRTGPSAKDGSELLGVLVLIVIRLLDPGKVFGAAALLSALLFRPPSLTFETTHSMCRRCSLAARWRRVGAVCLKLATGILWMASVQVGLAAAYFGIDDPTAKGACLVVYFCALAVFGLSLFGWRQASQLKYPEPLRFIGRRPIYLKSMSRLTAP